jgi:hypothetical protein
MEESNALIELDLKSGRSIWCNRYFARLTYADVLLGGPTDRGDELTLQFIRSEVGRIFHKDPLSIIEPVLLADQIAYPRYCFAAEFTSSPIQTEMHLSNLVVIWFQNERMPFPDEAARQAIAELHWNRSARDYEV